MIKLIITVIAVIISVIAYSSFTYLYEYFFVTRKIDIGYGILVYFNLFLINPPIYFMYQFPRFKKILKYSPIIMGCYIYVQVATTHPLRWMQIAIVFTVGLMVVEILNRIKQKYIDKHLK